MVTTHVAEQLKTYNLRKLGNFKKMSETLGYDGEYPSGHPKGKFWNMC